MNQNMQIENPLFPKEEKIGQIYVNETVSKGQVLSIKELEVKNEIERKNKILDFVFTKAFKVVVISIPFLILCDIVFQHYDLEDTILTQAFDLIKYTATTVLGYLFASSSKNNH